jgi:ABC-type sugar transport system permease subunit
MYKFDLKATEAWSYFIPWLKAKPWQFVLYALFVLALVFVFVCIFALVCVLTCCIVGLPYVGTVILLPLYVTYRIFSVEFLAQFDPEFDLFNPAVIPAETE